jgi:hypothetical protein
MMDRKDSSKLCLFKTFLFALLFSVTDNVSLTNKSALLLHVENGSIKYINNYVQFSNNVKKRKIVARWSTEYKGNIATYLCN